jgi:hypothetical protein
MGMLERIKKRQIQGFKEFVVNLETSGLQTRGHIFMAGVLEDSLYMSYVMKNIRTFEDFLELDSDDIDTVLSQQDQLQGLFAKCFFGASEEKLMQLETVIPRFFGRFKDELTYLKEVTPAEREGARTFILKLVRKLQHEERIHGFRWNLPPQDFYYPKQYKDGGEKIYFENGVLAAEGSYLKGRRIGEWHHFYETGALLASGDYFDGDKTGNWIFHFSSGAKKAEGKYLNDEKHGSWREWDRKGVESEVIYDQGVRKG